MARTRSTDTAINLSSSLALPIDAVTQTFAILGKRGRGKTNTAVVLAEELIGSGLPVVVVDTVGAWWGLRSSADGKKAGLPVVVFGGDHGDVPLDESAGKLIADVILEHRISAVVDTSILSKAGARRFLTAFVTQVYHRNREPLHIIFDEADELAPQRPGAEGIKLLGAMEDFVRRGRLRGLGCTLVTQRPAVLHKDVLTQAEVLVSMGMTGPRDVAAINEWVQLHADDGEAKIVRESLASLPVGTGWVWSPEWLGVLQRVEFRERRTFDSSATPKVGQMRITPSKKAAIDLTALGEQITAMAEKQKAEDPAALRRQIAALEKQLRERPTAEPVERIVEVDKPVIFADVQDRFDKLLDALKEVAGDMEERLQQVRAPQVPDPATHRFIPTALTAPGIAPSVNVTSLIDGEVQLRSGARRMVEALGRMWPLRLTKSQWGTVAKLKTSGGTWSTYLGDIRRAGLLDETSTGYTLTEAGFDYLGGHPDPMTPGELQAHYRSILRSGAAKMLDAVIAAYPEGLTREQLSDAAGIAMTGGTFSTYLGDLTRNGLAEKHGNQVRATEILIHGSEATQS